MLKSKTFIIMMMFWLICLIIKLDLVFSKNVEIIKDSPPKIIPVNEGSVYIDYQNSVVIQNYSHIRNIELRVKIGSNKNGVLWSQTRMRIEMRLRCFLVI